MLSRIPNVVWFVLFFALICGIGFGVWQSSTASHLPCKPPADKQDSTSTQKPTNEGPQDIAAETVAYYTKVLAWFTGVLALASLAQGIFLIRADRTANKTANATIVAANAAKESADAALAAERARFFVVFEGTNLDWLANFNGKPFTPRNIVVTYRFKNYGKTPGIITESCFDSKICADRPNAVFTTRVENFPEWMIAAGDPTAPRKHTVTPSAGDSEIDAIAKNRERIWVWGRLYYDDVFGNHHRHHFCFRSFRDGPNCFLLPYEIDKA